MKYALRTTVLSLACLAVAASCAAGQSGSYYAADQSFYDPSLFPQYPQYVQYPQAAPPVEPAVPAGQVLLSSDQLDQLLGPIALYPDPLLALMFPAATYPQDIAAAEQWLEATPEPSEDAINAQPWDESIKGLVHYPTVLKMMSDQMDWTHAVGAAFLNQQQDVMDSIQRLRTAAEVAQNLQSNQQEQVLTEDDAIRIEPVNPDLIYVPQYDAGLVYESPCPITFGVGFPIGLWCDNDFDWGRDCVVIGGGWFSGWHHPADWDRHPPGWFRHPDGWRPDPHPWTRAATRPAPRLTPTDVTRTGLDHARISPARRPEVVNKLPAAIRPRTPAVRPATPAGRIGNRGGSTPPANVFIPDGNHDQVERDRQRTNFNVTPAHPTPAQPTRPQVVVPPARPRVTPARPSVAPPPRFEVPAPRTVSPPAMRSMPAPTIRSAPTPRLSVPQMQRENAFRGSSGGGQTRIDSGRGRSSRGR